MSQTVEAVIDKEGKVQLLESIQLAEAHRALVTSWLGLPVKILQSHPLIDRAEPSQEEASRRHERHHFGYKTALHSASGE